MNNLSERAIRFVRAWPACIATDLPYSRQQRIRVALAALKLSMQTPEREVFEEPFLCCLSFAAQAKDDQGMRFLVALDRSGASADAQAAVGEDADLVTQAIHITATH